MTMPDHIKQWRKEQRAALIAARMAASPDDRRAWSDNITASLLAGFPVLEGAVVGLYWPIRGEFDPRPAVRHLRQRGARAALPVVLQKNAPLQFREWWPGVSTTKGVFDLPVPVNSDVLTPQALLIPPIGFDSRGYRLGYGGGYFDRTLAAMTPHPLKIGIAFELSRMATIQPQPHDIPLDFIVTEADIYFVGPAGLERIAEPARAGKLADDLIESRHRCDRNGDHWLRGQVACNACNVPQYSSPSCYAHESETGEQ